MNRILFCIHNDIIVLFQHSVVARSLIAESDATEAICEMISGLFDATANGYVNNSRNTGARSKTRGQINPDDDDQMVLLIFLCVSTVIGHNDFDDRIIH